MKIRAFTLAEVLITLGIMGIVASMTIPTIIQKHKKNIVETRMKKFYSTINQAILLSENDNGDKKYWTPKNTDELWSKYLKNYLKNIGIEDISYVRPRKIVYFADGSAVIIDIYFETDEDGNTSLQTTGGHFLFCPEAKYCRVSTLIGPEFEKKRSSKIFSFGFWPNTSGEKWKYHYNKGVEPYKVRWNGDMQELKTKCYDKSEIQWCTTLIQLNNWKIPDDYPYQL